MAMYGVSIVVPVTDEAQSLYENVSSAIKLINPEDICEFIFVTWEKTTDDAYGAINRIINDFPDVKTVVHTQKMPKIKGALYESLYIAKGTHVAHFTGDPDTQPSVLAEMVKKSKENPDAVVIASRWIKGGGFEGYGKVSKACNFAFQQMLRALYGSDVHDYTYSFRLFPTESMKRITWEKDDFPVVLENTLKLRRLGYKFIEVPAVWKSRTQGKSRNSFLFKFTYLPVVFKVRFQKKEDILNQ